MSETVVVGYDGSDPAGRALDRAIETAKEGGGSVVVVVVEAFPLDPGAPGDTADLTAVRPPTDFMANQPSPDMQAAIDDAEKRAETAGVESSTVWAFGDPARTMVDAAREHHAAKIFIGADHHGFFGKLLGQDVEAEVKREADCEVIVVK
jgi:nucleotide-binding universal stress UspA family protein